MLVLMLISKDFIVVFMVIDVKNESNYFNLVSRYCVNQSPPICQLNSPDIFCAVFFGIFAWHLPLWNLVSCKRILF